jgi:hypothetical protein
MLNTNNNATDRLLSEFRQGMVVSYASASTLSAEAGQVTCSNSAGTIRKMRSNPSATTITWSDIDTGAEAISTTYYVYAVADADATTVTFKISISNTAPTGVTYYKRLCSFYNNAAGDIEQIKNDDARVLLATGTAAHGETIPLPSGYAQSQCAWVVAPYSAISTSNSGVDYFYSYATSARVIVSQIRSHDGTTSDGTVNYMIVGYK